MHTYLMELENKRNEPNNERTSYSTRIIELKINLSRVRLSDE